MYKKLYMQNLKGEKNMTRIDVKDFDEQETVRLKMIAQEKEVTFSEWVRAVLEKDFWSDIENPE